MRWETKLLGDVIERTQQVDPTRSPNRQFSYIDVSGVSNQSFTVAEPVVLYGKDAPSRARKQIRAGDVLFATVRPTLKRIAIIPEELDGQIASTGYFVFRPKPELTNRFLFYFLLSDRFQERMEGLQKGASYPAVTDAEVRSQNIPLPPLPEQQRIVSKLDAAFAALSEAEANVERNRANARELFESYLNGVFEGKDGWEERTLGDLGKVCMCKRIMKHQTTSTGDVPFYKIGTFGKAPDAFIAEDIYQEFKKKYSFPKKGDVLISASGTIGRGVVYDGEPAYFQDSNIVWIDNNEEQVLNEYLFHFYKVCNWNPSKGATISRLYNDDLRRIKIAFPDLHEQRKLVEHMVELDERTRLLESTYQQKLDELAALKKGLLGAAFRGEL